MNEDYAPHAGLSAADVAALQVLYGTRSADAFDAAKSNNTRATASALSARLNGLGEFIGDRWKIHGQKRSRKHCAR